MTTPTQAQIEAAVISYFGHQSVPVECRYRIAAALTAAAEAGEPEYLYEKEKRTLTKTAQVKNATIERCIQAVMTVPGISEEIRLAFTAAIRALKEK